MARLSLLIISLCVFLTALTQPGSSTIDRSKETSKKGFNKENLRYGGNLGLNISNVTYIEITPTVAYFFHKRCQAGLGLNYIYYSYAYNGGFDRYSTNIYGANIFERYYLVDNVFQHAELEFLNYDVPTFDPSTGSIELNRKTVSALYLGLGYQSGQNGRGSYISFLYDIFYDVHSRNPNPYVFRIGFNF